MRDTIMQSRGEHSGRGFGFSVRTAAVAAVTFLGLHLTAFASDPEPCLHIFEWQHPETCENGSSGPDRGGSGEGPCATCLTHTAPTLLPDDIGFSDEGTVQFTNRIDPSEDPTRDNVVVDPSSGSLTFSIPLPYSIRGRATDFKPKLTFQSSRNSPGAKFGHFWQASWQKLLVIEFADELTCESGTLKTTTFQAMVNSVPRLVEYDGTHGTRVWTNRDAIEAKYAFEEREPIGIPSGSLSGMGEFIPYTEPSGETLYAVSPPMIGCVAIPKSAMTLGPERTGVPGTSSGKAQKIGNTTLGGSRQGWSDFVPPLGVYDKIVFGCGKVEIRRSDGTIDEFGPFINHYENTFEELPPEAGDPTPDAIRVQVFCLPKKTTFPNGDTILYKYDAQGRHERLIDNYGRAVLTLTYADEESNQVTQITDFLGRTTSFVYSNVYLQSITYEMAPSRTWTFGYTTRAVEVPDVEVRKQMTLVYLLEEFTVTAPESPVGRPFIHATFTSSNYSPPVSHYLETGRVATLRVGGFYGGDDPIDLDRDPQGTTDYGVPNAGKETTYTYSSGSCFEDIVVELYDSLMLHRTQTFDWHGREKSRRDHGMGPGGVDLVTTFEYHKEYPAVWKTTSPKGHITEEEFQFRKDDQEGKSYYTYPGEVEPGQPQEVPRDRFQGGNRLKLIRKPPVSQSGDPLVEEWTYEPLRNQVRQSKDARGNVTTYTFDYQEGQFSSALTNLICKWGIDMAGVPFDLGDQNGNLAIDQEYGLRIRVDRPLVTSGSLTLELNGGTYQAAVEKTAYNAAGQVLWERDAADTLTTYDYYPENDPDGDGELVDPLSPPGPPIGYLKSATVEADPFEDLVTTYGYTPLGDVSWTRNPRGFHDVSLFDGYQLVIAKFAGDVTENGTPVDPGVTPYTQVFHYYDLRNRRVKTRELNTEPSTASRGVHLGEVTTYFGYDLMDNVRIVSSELLDPLGNDGWMTTFYHYDGNGNVTEEVSSEGRAKSYVYDALGRVTSKRVHLNLDTLPAVGGPPDETGEDPFLSFQYDKNSNKEKLTIVGSMIPPGGTEPRNIAYRMLFDVYDRKQALETLDVSTGLPLLRTEQDRDANGNITAVRRLGPRDGADTELELLSEELYSYDERDRLFLVEKSYFQWTKDGAGSWQQLEFGGTGKTVAETAFDRRSLEIATKDDLERVTRISYDAAGREIERVLPLIEGLHSTENKKVLELDGNGNVIAEHLYEVCREEQGAILVEIVEHFETAFEYDALDRKVTETREPALGADAIVTRWEYTSLGDLRGSWNPNGIGTRHMFDTQRRDVLTRMGHAATDLELDDAEGVIVGPENVDGFILALREYDLDGNLLRQTDDKGNITATEFDAAGRRTKLTYADNSREDFTYHLEGTLKDEKQFDKNSALLSTITYAYDAVLRKTQADFSNQPSSGLSGVFRETFQYDGLSRVTRGVAEAEVPNHSNWNITSTIVKEYDSLDLVRKDDQAFLLVRPSGNDTYADVVTCVYDGVGNCTRVTTSSGYEIDYEFDELNRIRKVLQGANALASFEYLGSSFRLREQTNENGTKLVIGTSRYDAFRRITGMKYEQVVENQPPVIQTEFSYAYDKVGSQLEEVKAHDEPNSKKFVYDNANRLTEYRVGSPPFATSTLVEWFGLDGVGNWIDHNGNTNAVNAVHEYQYEFDETTAVAYDGRGNLKQYGSKTFTYDAKGRIVASTIGAQEYYYAFDVEGRRVLAEVNFFTHAGLREIRQVKATQQTIVQEYVYGNELDELLSFVKSGNRYHVQRNSNGSTAALTDASGIVIERYDYSPFGVVSGGGTVNCRYLFGGRRLDDKSGLYFLRARCYSAAMGRFISRDPIGVWGDEANWGNPLTFGGNNPQYYIDPLGTKSEGGRCSGGMDEKPNWFDKFFGRGATKNNAVVADKLISDMSAGKFEGRFKESAGVSENDPRVKEVEMVVTVVELATAAVAIIELATGAVQGVRGFLAGGGKGAAAEVGAVKNSGTVVSSTAARTEAPAASSSAATNASIRSTATNAQRLGPAGGAGAPRVGGRITGHSGHGIDQVVARDGGRGVHPRSILDAVRNPNKIVERPNGTTRYVGKEATVVLNSEGRLVTAWGRPRNRSAGK